METTVYKIKKGDTLGDIAKRFGVSLYNLMDLNPHIEDPDRIYVGASINVPGRAKKESISLIESTAYLPNYYLIAQNEMAKGVREYKGKMHNQDILKYHATTTLKANDDETPWCSAFVNWCVTEAGYSGTNSAAARSWLKWGFNLIEPAVGCIVVLSLGGKSWQGHVGFVVELNDNVLYVLGGNQNNMICVKPYSHHRVLGYRTHRE
jgi:uncharacterized protein (TIGR02594 family)